MLEKRGVTYRAVTIRERRSQQNGTVFLGNVLDGPAAAWVRVRIRIGTLYTQDNLVIKVYLLCIALLYRLLLTLKHFSAQ